MFFILSKVLLIFTTPYTWFITSVFCAFFLKNEKWKKRFKYIAVFVFFFFSNTVILAELMRKWEVHGTRFENTKIYDVGIVLGGMSEYNSDLDVLSITGHGDRIWQAITLYKKGKIKKILISGDSGYITDRGLHEAKQFKKVLVEWGIPANDLLVEEKSKNTHENAVETQKVLNRSYPHFTKFLLITSGSHMRRSLACFNKVGLKCDSFSTDLITGPHRNYFWDQYFIPNQDAMGQWNKLIKEWIGYFVYDLVGYI
ncbi:MAG: YdcF family protein [Flavobacteriia bacterium]|nr:YdcF family protein [Flavobacteriia bacterium]